MSPYTNTLICDSDLIFIGSLDKFLVEIPKHSVVLTQFENWITSGSIMSSRVKRLTGSISDEQLQNALKGLPAINIGLIGYNKVLGQEFLSEWSDVTEKIASTHIADEVAMQGVFFKYSNKVMDSTYNTSSKMGKVHGDTKVVHFHGNSHTSPERTTSRLWWAMFREYYSVDHSILKWLEYDKVALDVFKSCDDGFFAKCSREFEVIKGK
jgi:hypothetical protein